MFVTHTAAYGAQECVQVVQHDSKEPNIYHVITSVCLLLPPQCPCWS